MGIGSHIGKTAHFNSQLIDHEGWDSTGTIVRANVNYVYVETADGETIRLDRSADLYEIEQV